MEEDAILPPARDEGGAAFPVLPPLAPDNCSAAGYPYPETGMSLRDWFAGQAIAGLNLAHWKADELALVAYEVADAMIAERSRLAARTRHPEDQQ